MTLGELYTYVKFIVNQDQLGDMPSPSDLNVILKNGNIKLFSDEWLPVMSLHNEKGYPLSDLIDNTSSLRRFVKTINVAQTIAGPYTLPTDYNHYLSISFVINNVWRDCDVLSDRKYNKKREDVFIVPPTEKPYSNISEGKLHIIPLIPHKINLKYVRLPLQPVFDCCYTSGLDMVYMPVGSRIVASGGVNDLVASDGTVMETDVQHYVPVLKLPYTSQSIELDWDETEHDKFAEILISMISYRNRELQMAQLKLAENRNQ